MRTPSRNTNIVIFLFVLVLSIQPVFSATEAEIMVTKLPDDAIGFIATSGGDALKYDFEKTYIGQIWNDPGVQDFYKSVKSQFVSKIKQEAGDPNQAKVVDIVMNLAEIIISKPIVAGCSPNSDDDEPLCGLVIVDAGSDKEQIAAAITELENLAPDGDINSLIVSGFEMHSFNDYDCDTFYWGWVGSHFVIAAGDTQQLALRNILSPNAAPLQMIDKVPATDDVAVLHFNFERLISLIEMNVSGADKEEMQEVMAVLERLGLADVKSITERFGFSDTDIVADSLIEVPAPRGGLFNAIKPVDLDVLDAVDSRAMVAYAANIDFASIYDTIFDAVKAASPNDAYPEMQAAVSQFESQTKISIREGILESLAGPMAFYTLPQGASPMNFVGGVVAFADLKDPNLFAKNMSAMEVYIASQSNGGLQIGTQILDGRTVHNWVIAPLAMMQIIPCWTVVDDQLVICSNTNMISGVAKQLTSSDPAFVSLKSSDAFEKISPDLPDNILCFQYVDSASQFNQIMMTIQQFWPMITMAMIQEGLQLPVMLPQLGYITEKMHPAFGYGRFDSTGLRCHYKGPGVEQSLASVAGVSLGAGILMPALSHTRHDAQRVMSASNLRQIGNALFIYANEHEEKLPPDLQTLIEYVDLSPKSLESPRKPQGSDGPGYIYISGQDVSMHPANVLIYENPEFFYDGVNVLYLDGHVDFVRPEQFKEDIEQTYQRLGKPAPEIKFKD